MSKESEILEIYDLKGRKVGEQERERFIREIKRQYAETGRITRKVNRIQMLLMNSVGRIYLQRRSMEKGENPGMFDKTIGAHVIAGHSFDTSVIKESAEELGFPASVVPGRRFDIVARTSKLHVVGVFRKIGQRKTFWSIRKTKDGGKFVQPYNTVFYIGYYDGPIQFRDGEASGVQTYSLEELQQALKRHPDEYTHDVHHMVREYAKHLVGFRKRLV